MISEQVFRNKITNTIKKIVDNDPFFEHFKDYINAVFVDHGDKFIVFSHSKAKADIAGGFQYPNKIYIDKAYIEKLIAKYEDRDGILELALDSLLQHELRHFIQCVVMIELCDDVKEAEKCWKYHIDKIKNKTRLEDPLELDIYLHDHALDKTIEEFYDFIKCLIEDYRKSL